MHRHSLAPMLAGALLFAASCGTMDGQPAATQPTPVGAAPSQMFAASEPVVSAQAVRDPFCPSVDPFRVAAGLVVQAQDVGLIVTQISARFTDSAGVQAPQVTLPAPVPTTQFGSALVAARSQRTFPVVVGIGCGTGRTGTVMIFVSARDDFGRMRSGQVTVVVR